MCCEKEKMDYFEGCFACGRDNPKGLMLSFDFDKESKVVTSHFILDKTYSGYENIIHGGIVSTVLDETMAYMAMKAASTICMTKEICIKFHMPVRSDEEYSAESVLVSEEGNEMRLHAKITDNLGKVCAEADSTFIRLNGRRAEMMMKKLRRR